MRKGKFTADCLQGITPYSKHARMETKEASTFILGLLDKIRLISPRIDFGEGSDLTDQEYRDLTGLNRSNFDILLTFVGNTRNSRIRSKRNALGMFLMRQKLNLSQKFLSFLFRVENQAAVSRTLDSILDSLECSFLPKYLGFGHVTREDVIRKHTIPSFQPLLRHSLEDEDDPEYPRMILVFDATYLFIQKPSDADIQRRTFSQHKLRNLIKPMLVVTTTGYIVYCSLPYYTDGSNNDAAILDHMMEQEENGILDFFEIGDRAIYDRGFRDVVKRTEDHGIYPHMPNLLHKTQRQFSCEQGNESRKVTMVRWVVEAVNGRQKKNKMFESVSQYTLVENGKLGRLFRLSCALSNAFSPPLSTETEFHEKLIQYAMDRQNVPNGLQELLAKENLLTKRTPWEKLTIGTDLDFPVLTIEELKILTVGSYQLKIAKNYVNEHLGNTGNYEIFLHKEKANLLKAKIQSRFCKAKIQNVWIDFDIRQTGLKSIKGYYCTCRAGARTLGACALVTSVIWYFSHARHNPKCFRKPRSLAGKILDAAAKFTKLGVVDDGIDAEASGEDSE